MREQAGVAIRCTSPAAVSGMLAGNGPKDVSSTSTSVGANHSGQCCGRNPRALPGKPRARSSSGFDAMISLSGKCASPPAWSVWKCVRTTRRTSLGASARPQVDEEVDERLPGDDDHDGAGPACLAPVITATASSMLISDG